MKRKYKIVFWIAGVLLVSGLGLAALGWWVVYGTNTGVTEEQGYLLFVTKDDTLEGVTEELTDAGVLIRPVTFRWVAEKSRSAPLLKPGRYLIKDGMSNFSLLQMLRNGLQTPLMFTFNNLNFIEDFCGVAGRVFWFDSLDMVHVVRNEAFLDSLGIRTEMLLGHLLPNSYEVFWTTTPERLILRMLQESERFWSGARTQKLNERGLDKEEVLILASIIQKETNHLDEMSRMAGVYINRLRQGIKLQADPTVKFALGDLSIRRVLYRHLEYPSPYNTYYTYGLPPGVICAPNPATIDQVLNYEEHNYLFFCAKPGYNSRHAFAVTNAQHEQNRRRYHAWLRSEGIR